MISLATINPAPLESGWGTALRDLDLAQQLCIRAHLAMLDAPPGALLPAVDAWHAAEDEVARCMWREEVERKRAHGRPWLTSIRGGR